MQRKIKTIFRRSCHRGEPCGTDEVELRSPSPPASGARPSSRSRHLPLAFRWAKKGKTLKRASLQAPKRQASQDSSAHSEGDGPRSMTPTGSIEAAFCENLTKDRGFMTLGGDTRYMEDLSPSKQSEGIADRNVRRWSEEVPSSVRPASHASQCGLSRPHSTHFTPPSTPRTTLSRRSTPVHTTHSHSSSQATVDGDAPTPRLPSSMEPHKEQTSSQKNLSHMDSVSDYFSVVSRTSPDDADEFAGHRGTPIPTQSSFDGAFEHVGSSLGSLDDSCSEDILLGGCQLPGAARRTTRQMRAGNSLLQFQAHRHSMCCSLRSLHRLSSYNRTLNSDYALLDDDLSACGIHERSTDVVDSAVVFRADGAERTGSDTASANGRAGAEVADATEGRLPTL